MFHSAWEKFKGSHEELKTAAQILALGAAALFFITKLLGGFMVVDMDLSVVTSRVPHPTQTNKDMLAVKVILEKGENGAVRIHDGQVRISYGQNSSKESIIRNLQGIKRIGIADKKLDWTETSDTPIQLPPGEKTQFATFALVPKSETCVVECAILGKRSRGRSSAQWQASAVSLPHKSLPSEESGQVHQSE